MEIYALLNKQTNKTYVGQTGVGIQNRLTRHLWDASKDACSHYPLYRAIRKYGADSFDAVWLGETNSQDAADNLEKLWIILLQSDSHLNGYNIREGGHRGKNSPETRRKISESNLGRKAWNRGIPMRPETKEKLIATFFQLGHTVCIGRVFSEDTKKKIGAASKGRWLGRKHSEESKQKMAEARRKWHATRKVV